MSIHRLASRLLSGALALALTAAFLGGPLACAKKSPPAGAPEPDKNELPVYAEFEKGDLFDWQEAKRVNRIRIEGADAVSARTLRSVLNQKTTPWYKLRPGDDGYDHFWAKEDARRIELYYRGQGFYEAKVLEYRVEPDSFNDGVTLTYVVHEGEPVLVDEIEIVSEDGAWEDIPADELLKDMTLEKGEPFRIEPYQEDRAMIETRFKDDAFYRARVERTAEVDLKTRSAKVKYIIVKGGRYRISGIGVEGNVQTAPEVVYRALDIEEGTRWRRNEVLADQRRVQRLPIYQTVRVDEEADDENKRIDLTFRVMEAEPQLIKIGVGYGTEEFLRVQGSWRHVNFLGGARELEVSARWSRLLEKETISFVQPNISRPGDYFRLTAERRIETEESYTYESLALTPNYHLILTDYLTSDLSYHIEQNTTSDIQDELEIDQEDLAKEGLLSAAMGRLDWIDVDNEIDPTRGARAGLYLEYAGGPLGGDFNYVKAIGEARGYYPIVPDYLVGAVKQKVGWSEPLGSLGQIPLFKRFYVGGTTSVRGFGRHALGPLDSDKDPIGGAKMYESSAELRFPIYQEFGGVVFMDGGWVWLEDQDYDPGDVIYSAGFGIRYDTPIGPVSIDIGFPMTGRDDYNDPTFHFNIGNSF